jgi:hypothetical protein
MMKRVLQGLVFVVWSWWGVGEAQDWCHPGSTWHYSWYAFNEYGIAVYNYDSDTLVEGQACHTISGVAYRAYAVGLGHFMSDTTYFGGIYTYSQNDSVFFYYHRFHKWSPTYFFNVQVGDTITMTNHGINSSSDSTVRAVVDSTGVLNINSQLLRYYTFQLIDNQQPWCGFRGKVIERLGMWDNNIIPFWHCVTDDYYYYFRCYQDDSIVQYPWGIDCDFLYLDVIDISNPKFQISNPATNTLTLQSTISFPSQTVFQLFDVSGRMVKEQEPRERSERIDVSALSKGMYLYRVVSDKKSLGSGKVVIER